ncbi:MULTISPECIES: alpha/beta hydrolase [unclassified Acinetobacter]|uniref:alpha/beta hydrolase n=1 Tax=unclassified Acinetobacter TaxID=196816 RepID=UPI0035B8C673
MTTHFFATGEAGQLEVFVNQPHGEIKGIALVTHPHPLMGGNPKHKIPQLICEVLVEKGFLVWRPSFRGMGHSQGEHDLGEGESRDIALLAEMMQKQYPNLPFFGGGFSFGSHVWSKSFHLLPEQQRPQKLLLAGLPCGKVRELVEYKTPHIDSHLLLVHGEQDDITPLADVIAWATPQRHPITIMPGANHFFTGYLKSLRVIIDRYY